MRKFMTLAGVLLVALALTGCQTIPPDAFKLSESALEDRKIQSRLFETQDEMALMAAGIGVLQDMGYAIDETEKHVGLITASKNADATSGAQVAGAVLVALLGGGSMPIDKEQKVRVSLVTKPSRENVNAFVARITFQRIVWNTQNQVSRVETIKDEALYGEFFDKLSKSVFLEAHAI